MFKRIWARLRELFFNMQFLRYTISGGIVTLVDMGVFFLLSNILGLSKWYLSLLPAIVLSILTAYVLNRVWVFKSKQSVISEIFRFCAGRLVVSLVFQYLGFYVVYDVIGFKAEIIPNLPWAKAIALLFVVIGNFLVGKFYVFTDCGAENSSAVSGEDDE
ncbi:MAG: GtrA family protein [Eubacteriales bacterium]|nr:GtrA family protein [Eubacteriales bacterium]MDD4324344.1 GtrA family protein [Eubacteriales bacterium]